MINPNDYRSGVGMMIFNSEGKVFVAQRIDTPNAWQMPQGGIDKDEKLRETVMREVEEEIGTDKVEIVHEACDWLNYDLPPEIAATIWDAQYKGQIQKWFLLKFTGKDEDINIHDVDIPEFNQWKWIEPEKLLDSIVSFKKEMYKQILAEFIPVIKEMSKK